MSISLNDLKDSFFKQNTSSTNFPLFSKLSSVRGMSQIDFLKKFFPETNFLKKISENVFLGIGTSASQRSTLFNHSLPLSRGKNLCAQIIEVFDSNLWKEMLSICKNTIEIGLAKENEPALNEYLNCLLSNVETDIPLIQNNIDYLLNLSLVEKTESVVFFILLISLYADQNVMSTVFNIIKNNSTNPHTITAFGDYRYISFGHYPQTVADEQTSLQLATLIPKNGIYYFNENKYIKFTSNLHSDYKIYRDDFVFSNGNPIENQKEYFFKLEPIKWRILTETDTDYFILSDKILDHILFNTQISRTTLYYSGNYLANSWEGSSIFNWFNNNYPGCFLHDAFSQEEQDQIKEIDLSNSSPWKENADTNQKIFALSYNEAIEYLLHYNSIEKDVQNHKLLINDVDLKPCFNAIAFMTDYAICRGVCPSDFGNYLQYFEYPLLNNTVQPTETSLIEMCKNQGRWNKGDKLKTGTWWLRSPGNPDARFKNFDEQNDYTRRVCDIMEDGHLCERGSNVDGGLYDRGRRPESCDGTRNGIRPALYLKK